MERSLLFLLTLLIAIHTKAQRPQQESAGPIPEWQQVWHDMMDIDEEQENAEQTEAHFDILSELAEHPLDLNLATRDELESLPFLSDQQVMDLIEYRDRYGPLLSFGELRMVRSMDYQQLGLLPYFTYVGEVKEEPHFPSLDNIVRYGRSELTASLRYPFYDRKGDQNGYLGYKLRHWMRYEFSYGNYVRLGLMGSQDAGEPFFANRNAWGYDNYSPFLQIKKLGSLEHLILGKYKLSTGMGLVLNNSFSLGKLNTLQSLGRSSSTIRPHVSQSVADYFLGAATTLRLVQPLQLTLFASHRPLDATLNNDGSVATIIVNGYHRTPKEMEKKHNTHQSAAGAHLTFQHQGLRLGATAVYTHLDRRLNPSENTLYRKHHARGNNFLNASLSYRYLHHRFSLNGETAIDQNGALATLNALSYQSPASWSLVLLQRFYSYRYTSLHGHAFSEGGHVQNESGIYLGASWQPMRRLQLRGYFDYAYFPWARYRVSESSEAYDCLAEAIVQLSQCWSLKARYRLHVKQMDNQAKSGLLQRYEHRTRLTASYRHDAWQLVTQADYNATRSDSLSQGWMLSQNVGFTHKQWQATLSAAYFDTQSYDSRIYFYERQLPRSFAFPMCYGNGLRVAVVARVSLGRWLQVDAKVGCTHYLDRHATGNGLQLVDGSTLTDGELQARWRF